MKNFLMLVSTLLITSNVFAGTSATLKLVGSVPKKFDLAIDVSSATLDLTATKSDFKVATLTEKSNSSSGYKVTVASAGLGHLVRVGGTEKFSYNLKYGGQSVGLGSTAGGSVSTSSTGVVTNTKDVTLSYTGVLPESMVEGSYEDTLTFTISAN
jgi:hypothetical protein